MNREHLPFKSKRIIILVSWWVIACVSTNEKPTHLESPHSLSLSHQTKIDKVGRSREPTEQEQKLIRELMQETERIRGLRFLKPVPVLIQDRTAITAHIEGQIEDEDLERARIVYAALGLLKSDLNIKALLLRVLGEQILGYYDPKAGRLVVRDEIMQSLESSAAPPASGSQDFQTAISEARISLVHELTHALQNQHLSLSENIEKKRDIDEENAFRSLIEGDATLVMYGYMLQIQQPNWTIDQLTSNPVWIRSLSSMIDQMPMAGPELANAPPIIRIPLLSAYVDGLTFAAHLHGNNGWEALNNAHIFPPVSTEQVLHPTRFFKKEMPNKVDFPELPSLRKAGYVLLEEDTLGELEISIYFGQGIGQDRDEKAATGWNWDRLRVYSKKNHQTPVVWFTIWDDEKEAEEAQIAANRVLDELSESERSSSRVIRKKRVVLIIRQLPTYLHKDLIDTWNSWGNIPPL